ncbi:MAG: hypothetical protein ABIR62_03520 [Dokdonella sp.]
MKTRTPSIVVIDRRGLQLDHSPVRSARPWRGIALAIGMSIVAAYAASPASALTLCANSVSSLQTAINIAGFAQEPVTIRIATGTYAIPGLSANFTAPTTLLGGYDAGCTARPAMVRPMDTILDFSGHGVIFSQGTGQPVSLFAIDGVSLLNTLSLGIGVGDWGDEGDIRLSHTRITGVPSSPTSIKFSAWGGGVIRLDNVLMDTLPGGMPAGDCSVEITPRWCATLLLVSVSPLQPNPVVMGTGRFGASRKTVLNRSNRMHSASVIDRG